MRWCALICVGLCATFAPVGTANAAIIGGTVTTMAPPANIGSDNQNVDIFLGFNERQNVLLTAPLETDDPAGTIAAGTWVSSHYIFYDPGPTDTITGTAVFDEDILGMMTSTETLTASEFLGAPGTNYLNPTLLGLEAGSDTAAITDSRTVTVTLQASSPGDYIRVVTTPEPASLALLAIAGAATLSRRRRRSRQTSVK